MEFIITQVIIPLVIGVITAVIANLLTKPPNRKIVLLFGVLSALIVAIVVLLLPPPYKVMNVNWCLLKTDGTFQVKGRLVTLILGQPVPDHTVQITVFPAGGVSPFKAPKFSNDTGVDGSFLVEFPPPGPTSGSNYLINTAYNYDAFLQGEKWITRNFQRGEPPPCQNK